MTQAELLLHCFKMIIKSNLFPETKPRDWVKILLFLHKKGYLWAGFEEGKPALVAVGYRVKEAPKEYPKNFPDKEEGNKLYVAFMISYAKDKMLPKKLLTKYLEKYPEVNEIILHDLRDNEKLKTYKRKERENGKEQIAGTSGSTDVSGRSPVYRGT